MFDKKFWSTLRMFWQTENSKLWKWEKTKKISLLLFNQAGRQKVLPFLMEKKSKGKKMKLHRKRIKLLEI
jgi:hypothetical protein